MPKATVDIAPVRHDLKTLPPDGFVVLRRMSYGEKMLRQQLATAQYFEAEQNASNRKLNIDLLSKQVAIWEFANLILEHNLEDDSGNMLDFRMPQTIEKLDPRVGDEISAIIAEMNNYEEEGDQQGNS